MKNYLFLLGFILCLSSCVDKNDPLGIEEEEHNEEWEAFCNDLEGGDVDLTIEGKDWSTSCAQAVYTESVTEDYEYRQITVLSYNHWNPYKSDSDLEFIYLVWIEVRQGEEVETTIGAYYYDAFYDYYKALNDPDYEIEDIEIFASDFDNTNSTDVMNITEIKDGKVEGNVNFKLYNQENPDQTMSVTGNFSANIAE